MPYPTPFERERDRLRAAKHSEITALLGKLGVCLPEGTDLFGNPDVGRAVLLGAAMTAAHHRQKREKAKHPRDDGSNPDMPEDPKGFW